MSKSFDDVVMATYAELCVLWRMELVSCRSNAKELNTQLRSLEEVLKAFNLAPDLGAKTKTAEQAPQATEETTEPEEDRLKVTTSEINLQPRPQSQSMPEPRPAKAKEMVEADPEVDFEFSESDYSDSDAELTGA